MTTLAKFFKVTLVGGLLVLLPIWISLLLLFKAIDGALKVFLPLAKLVPQTFVHPKVIAFIFLLLVCSSVGLLVHMRSTQRIRDWIGQNILDHIPGFSLVRSMTRRLAGDKSEQSFQPALVEIEEALVPAFIIEQHPDGQFTVFVSSSPTPMAGAIYILSPERVHPVDMPLTKALVCITKWGSGAAEMRAAMLAAKKKE